MKIVQLAAGNLESGAGQGARWLHRALLSEGVDSELYGSRIPYGNAVKEFRFDGVSELWLKILSRLDRLPLKMRNIKPVRNYSSGVSGVSLKGFLRRTNADILHLHYINTGYVDIRSLKNAGVPIVWTFRDMWPFTGGCHYSWDCCRYLDKCGSCPILSSSNENDISRKYWRRKFLHYSEIDAFYPVAISPWLQKCSQSASALKGVKVDMIWNGVDTEHFQPIDRIEARKTLGLPIGKPILLLGASRVHSILKGYGELLNAISLVRNNSAENFDVVRFGALGDGCKEAGDVIDLGYINSRNHLNLVYAAADVFLAPSPQEAFGKTIVESLASGTPVVVFGGSGSEEIVNSKDIGEVVESGDYSAVVKKGLDLIKRSTVAGSMIREKCVSRSVDFSTSLCALSYMGLYKKILFKNG
tara:strand:+ start:6371 stop:7615 length:1245 start_codon:yes stop_codon:yes gene_type:complete